MYLRRMLAPLALLAVACHAALEARHAGLSCSAPAVTRWLPDSAAALCLPPGFVARGPRRFARPRGDTLPEQWIAVMVQRDPALRPGERWPLTLASSAQCIADCTSAEDVVTAHDRIAGVPAYIERGLLSGGIAGEHRVPALVASVDGRPGWTAVVQVRTADPLLRDSLAAALTTLHIYSKAVRDR
jgi:hypothetical protein